jgi:hypothetical protein
MWHSISISLAICCFSAAPALAGDCPAGEGDGKVALVAKASSCQEAVRLFKLCAIGASLDGRLAASVHEVCERTVIAKLPEKEREAYEAAIAACNAPYVRKRGTIYRSVAAHCRVDVMADFAKRH